MHIENTCHPYFLDLLLPFCFLAILGNLYITSTKTYLIKIIIQYINTHRQIDFLPLILLTLLDIFAKKIKKGPQ